MATANKIITGNNTTTHKTFPVLNMSCASCAASSENVLKMQPGVVQASVNYGNGQAQIEFVPSLTDAHQLKAALQKVGYDLMIDESEDAKESLENLQQAHFKALKRKTVCATVLSVPLLVIAMIPALMEWRYANYLMWALATPVVLIFGRQFFIGAYKQAKHNSANMDTLVALSAGIAYIFSLFNTLFPEFWHSRGMHPHVYFETAAVVITFVLFGKLLEEKAKGSTSSSIKKLMGLQPKMVTVVHEGGHQMEMPIASIHPGQVILVKPGEKIAVDGAVISGESYVDESMISGEPLPLLKKTGEKVFAGTINQKGSFQFSAEKVGGETLLAQIIKMVQDAQGSKAPVQKLVDKIAGIFVPVVMLIALLAATGWFIFGGENAMTQGFLALVTVLVIACPCALGLATPTAIMVGIGKAASEGILIKDAQSLEDARKVNTVILDKTGTITEGNPTVDQLHWFVPQTSSGLNILFSIESASEHPLAGAVTSYLKNKAEQLSGIGIENISGQGIRGIYLDDTYYIGNETLIRSKGIIIAADVENWLKEHLNRAQTVILFTNSQQVLATIAISDQIKPSSAKAIADLQRQGIEVHMLTGDNLQTAEAVAKQTGITHFLAGMLPADKAFFIKKLQTNGKIVAMVGDGINDSNALAQADVSIAMGKGSDIAMDVAKMTIISSDLGKIPLAIHLSKLTVTTLHQNLFWAFIYNIIGIPLAAGVLYPVNGFLLNPMIAGAAMALSSVSVVVNSLRLKWKK
ncbi:Cu2+-exporting ATPase [bacterium A37T11]|nr:Cu2+-exporting ATPase [bacterium A37T11]